MGSAVVEPPEPGEEPPEEAEFSVVASEGAYDKSSGIATFSWQVHTKEGEPPPLQKIACVMPTELPERFWEDYDSGAPMLDRERVDKKWRGLYIPLHEYGIPQFSMKTRIPGTYTFEVCGILDNDYSNKKDYDGDGSLTVEVPDVGLIVTEIKCEDEAVYETSKYTQCQWVMGFANGSEFDCWDERPHSKMNSTDGKTRSGMFEVLVESGAEKEYHILGPGLQLCDGYACGCGFGPYLTVRVAEGEPVTLSIVKVNEGYYTYTGDGDPIVLTFSG